MLSSAEEMQEVEEKFREQPSRRSSSRGSSPRGSSPEDPESPANHTDLDSENNNRSDAFSKSSLPSIEDIAPEAGINTKPLERSSGKLRTEDKVKREKVLAMIQVDGPEGSPSNVNGVSKRPLTPEETNEEPESKRQCIGSQAIVKSEPRDDDTQLPDLLQSTVEVKVSPGVSIDRTVSEAKDNNDHQLRTNIKPAHSIAPLITGEPQGSTNLTQEHPPGIHPEILELLWGPAVQVITNHLKSSKFWFLPKHLLRAKSGFFYTVIDAGFNEKTKNPKPIPIDNTSQATFETFIQWLYTGYFPYKPAGCHSAYILAERLECPSLQNLALHHIIRRYSEVEPKKKTVRLFLAQFAEHIFLHSLPRSVLRRLVVDWAVWLCKHKVIDLDQEFWDKQAGTLGTFLWSVQKKARAVAETGLKHPGEQIEQYIVQEEASSESEFKGESD